MPIWVKVIVSVLLFIAVIHGIFGEYARAAYEMSLAIFNVLVWKENND